MIRKLVLFGWFALLALLGAGATGYFVEPGSDRIPGHLLPALLAFGTLGLVFLCTTLYLLGMGRLVRKVSRECSLSDSWSREHRRLSRPGIAWSLLGLTLTTLAAVTGYPTHLGRWEPYVHHALFHGAALAAILSLWRLGPIVRDEERLVRALDGRLGS